MNDEKKNNEAMANNAENCSKVFTLSELSKATGIKIELLSRFISKQTRQMRNDAWEKIYPSIKELLGENEISRPRRIGPAYRRHAELVEMFSDQKVLLDVFNIFPASTQQEILDSWQKKVESAPTKYVSLSADENKIMGIFLAMDEEMRDTELLALAAKGREYIRSQR